MEVFTDCLVHESGLIYSTWGFRIDSYTVIWEISPDMSSTIHKFTIKHMNTLVQLNTYIIYVCIVM